MAQQSRSLETKDAIIQAALDIIIREGVSAVTFRHVAAQAGVSPGTMTYHFEGINDILAAAFTQIASDIAMAYASRLDLARNLDEAREAIVDIICGDVVFTPSHLLFSFELYAFISRQPEYRPIAQTWLEHNRKALLLHFNKKTARAIDALIEGYTIHRYLHPARITRSEVMAAVHAITN